MSHAEGMYNNVSLPVERLAQLVRSLDRRQKAHLIQLVPELQTIRPEEVSISPEQEELMAYFRQRMAALSDCKPLQDNDMFVEGLTVAEFFALPEEKQSKIWDQAHVKAERELGNREQFVQFDALPAR